MSDTTETLVTSSPAVLNGGVVVAPPVLGLSARDLLHLVQGLYCIFWGVLVAVVVVIQVLVSVWNRSYTEMFLGAAVFAILVGSRRLARTRLDSAPASPIGRLWQRRANTILRLALLLVYFAVLFFMWRGAVGNIYLQVNALAFIMVGIIYLIMLGRAVATLAAVLGHDSLAVESRLFNIGNIGILLLPCLLAVVYLGVLAIRHDTNLLIEFSVLLSRINLIAAVIFLLPLSLTLSLVWAAKDLALGRLAQVDTDRQQEGGS